MTSHQQAYHDWFFGFRYPLALLTSGVSLIATVSCESPKQGEQRQYSEQTVAYLERMIEGIDNSHIVSPKHWQSSIENLKALSFKHDIGRPEIYRDEEVHLKWVSTMAADLIRKHNDKPKITQRVMTILHYAFPERKQKVRVIVRTLKFLPKNEILARRLFINTLSIYKTAKVEDTDKAVLRTLASPE